MSAESGRTPARTSRTRGIAISLGTALLVVAVACLAGPMFPFRPAPDRGVAARVALAADLDAFLGAEEAAVPGVKPALRKGIVWRDTLTHAKTPLAIVYLHGFSASRGELSPVFESVGEQLGANIFFTRLAAHGRGDGEAFATVRPQQWMDDAREALAIGRRIGERVVVVGMSTGALLALQLAAEERRPGTIAALVLISPNHQVADPRARFISGPFGPWLARLLVGRTRTFPVANAKHAELWTRTYRSEGIVALMDLVNGTRNLDLSQITVPALTLYTHHDDVVDVGLIRSRHEQLGSPVKRIMDVAEATRHEMASDALGPQAVGPVVRLVLDFLRKDAVAGQR